MISVTGIQGLNVSSFDYRPFLYTRKYSAGPLPVFGFDQNHVHILCRFLSKYSGGQVIKIIKSISGKRVFEEAPETKKELWGGEFWTDGYYISTISGKVIRK